MKGQTREARPEIKKGRLLQGIRSQSTREKETDTDNTKTQITTLKQKETQAPSSCAS
jgi:hypothetical protein